MQQRDRVECPRCGMQRSLFLYRMVGSYSPDCPDCWRKYGEGIPMIAASPDSDPKGSSKVRGFVRESDHPGEGPDARFRLHGP